MIAILTFLAALCAGAAEIVASSANQWQGSVAQEVTIQVRPSVGRDIDADVARAESLAKATPGIASTRIFSKSEAERLLEPWLGSGLDLSDLPVPRLVTLKLAGIPSPGFEGIAGVAQRGRCRGSRASTTMPCGFSGSRPWPIPSSASESVS